MDDDLKGMPDSANEKENNLTNTVSDFAVAGLLNAATQESVNILNDDTEKNNATKNLATTPKDEISVNETNDKEVPPHLPGKKEMNTSKENVTKKSKKKRKPKSDVVLHATKESTPDGKHPGHSLVQEVRFHTNIVFHIFACKTE